MFEDSELPDFDAMSQEELIAWLEQLARSHSAASEMVDDYPTASPPESEDEGDAWSGWLDDTAPGAAALESDEHFVAQGGLGREADLPVDLSLFDDDDTAPTASLDWLDEIVAAQTADALPDFNKLEAKAEAGSNPKEPQLSRGEPEDDPLEWLSELDERPPAPTPLPAHKPGAYATPEDFDETWEDDESLDDLEDESLYSFSADGASNFLAALAGVQDHEAERQSTQSMPPLPADQPDTPNHESPLTGSAQPVDGLSKAFLIQEREEDLEAWYAERLRAIAVSSTPAAQPPPSKPPPPGLAAAINSARGKINAEKLPDALLDYETLLGTTAGLQWVVHDMRGLIAQARYRENASVHRVLGDALMRQGHLDAALTVYRHALSLL